MKLMIVDRCPLEGKAIEYILSKKFIGISYVGQAYSDLQGLELAKSLSPDIVIINVDILEIYSCNIVRQIKQIIPKVEIILTSTYNKFDLIHTALLQGARSYILKPISIKEFKMFFTNIISKNVIYNNEFLIDNNTAESDIKYVYCTNAKYYIELYINQIKDISLENISSELFISPFYLSRIFVECEGINFRNYVIQCKMKKAKLMLMTTHQSIDNIGKAVGYKDPSSFRRQFKKEIGISASIYRKTMGNVKK